MWKEKFTFEVHRDETLHLECWDKDKILRDDPMGNASVNLKGKLFYMLDRSIVL